MKHLNITRHVSVDPTFSWSEWGLYEEPGCVQAAERLNEYLAELVNEYDNSFEVRTSLLGFIKDKEYDKKFGAFDSETLNFIDCVLDEIFGDN